MALVKPLGRDPFFNEYQWFSLCKKDTKQASKEEELTFGCGNKKTSCATRGNYNYLQERRRHKYREEHSVIDASNAGRAWGTLSQFYIPCLNAFSPPPTLYLGVLWVQLPGVLRMHVIVYLMLGILEDHMSLVGHQLCTLCHAFVIGDSD